jgi:translation initiation factor 2 beta subunit (eIF-2beta)/eIF-5
MIYCNLKGGLGNMLFQVAAVSSMAIKKNTSCSFPNFRDHLNFLNQDHLFNPNMKHANEYTEFLHLEYSTASEPYKLYSYPFEYIDAIPGDTTFGVDGFFQTEKYFKNQRQEILKIIKPNQKINDILNTKYSFIKEDICTSIHVRRGDYTKFSDKHPTQDVKYYQKALESIEDYGLIIVFSDDVEWCKSVFKFKNMHFIENEKDYIELFLMARCKNNIIANSSFSWWGAWMNQHPDKKVVGPNKWFGPNLSHLNTNDIIPETWIKI